MTCFIFILHKNHHDYTSSMFTCDIGFFHVACFWKSLYDQHRFYIRRKTRCHDFISLSLFCSFPFLGFHKACCCLSSRLFLKQMGNRPPSMACTRPDCISACFWLRRLWSAAQKARVQAADRHWRKHCHFKLVWIYLASFGLDLVPASLVYRNRRPHASLFYTNVGDFHVIETKSRKKPVYLRAFLRPWLCRGPVHGSACQAEPGAAFYRVRLLQSVCVAFCFLSTKCIPGNQSSRNQIRQ